MKKLIALLLAALALVLSGCDNGGEPSLAEQTTASDTTATAPEGEPLPEEEYSEGLRQLMAAVKFDGEYCEIEDTRILTERITPDYIAILGEGADPLSYTEGTEGEIPLSAEKQALSYIKERVHYLFALNGWIYFTVNEDNAFSIYRLNAYGEHDAERLFTADTMGYAFARSVEVNSSGVIWRCANVDGMEVYMDGAEVSYYCQCYGGKPYCLDGFLNENPSVSNFVLHDSFDGETIYYVDYVPIEEVGGKSDSVPCVFAYHLAGGATRLYAFNSWNLRSRGGSFAYDSCDPNELGLPYTDEYAVNTRYDTPLSNAVWDTVPLYQYNEYPDGYGGEPDYGYLLGGENRQPIKLFVLTGYADPPSVTEHLAASTYSVHGEVAEYIAVMDYTDGKMCAVPVGMPANELGGRCSDSKVIYIPQSDGSIMTIRRA